MIDFKFPDSVGGPSKHTEQVTAKMPSKLLPLTPPRLASPILIVEEKHYPPCFDSDDEFESDDSSSIADSEISFRRRPITPPKSASKGKAVAGKAVSLLTMQLKRCRNRYPGILLKDSQLLLSDDCDEGPSAVHQEIQDPETARCSNVEWVSEELDAESRNETGGIEYSHHEHSTAVQAIEHDRHQVLTPIAEEPEPNEQQPIVTQANTCFKGPRKSSFLAAITKAIITNFKHYTNITWLPQKPPKQAIREQDDVDAEEDIDPYLLFFGNNQDRGIPPESQPTPKHKPRQEKGKGKQPATTTTTTTTTTNPLPVPLAPEQQQLALDQANLAIPFQEGWANDQSQIAKAGPLNIKSAKNKKRGDVSYIERDYDWVCCGCGAANSRFEFLCFRCRAHSKRSCCEEVVVIQLSRCMW
jgi:hypothetical protein